MNDPFEDGPECDFCGLAVEEGKSLEPIYVGELPQPKPHFLTGVARRGGMRDNRCKGKYGALRKALHECRDVELNEVNQVAEVKFTGGADSKLVREPGEVDGSPFEYRQNREKVGVEIKIRPKDVTYTPDAKVCDTCAEMFKGLDE